MVIWPRLGDPSVCQSPKGVCVSFPWTDAGLCIYHLFVWSNCASPSGSPYPPSRVLLSLLLLYSLRVIHVRFCWFSLTRDWDRKALLSFWGQFQDPQLHSVVIFSYAYTHTYTCRIIHNDTTIKDERRLLLKNMYLSLYCKGSKRVTQGFTVRGSRDRTELQYIDPLSLCLSHSPGMLNQSFLLSAGFLYHILSPTGLQNYWGPRGPFRPGVAFPTTSYQQLLLSPTHRGPRGPLRPGVAFPTTSRL